ncbi:hypothetical protein M427DRAFT_73050 [Gonapodya prolifera JEL478]|uniref:Uncharacterized protein n=1 Tax=Gonapodya prolifera (strain JEL478) TaxID=1344416 RepID=A0A139A3D1_GONPJ|nr:hypothetical protein M427DRAFT_73050 [Gonapodya prolifera JEL478]|eukprot:KXS11302.1 hypothetical protein M427DRAFT_73050 [Gonapodya prolifera JEL478]
MGAAPAKKSTKIAAPKVSLSVTASTSTAAAPSRLIRGKEPAAKAQPPPPVLKVQPPTSKRPVITATTTQPRSKVPQATRPANTRIPSISAKSSVPRTTVIPGSSSTSKAELLLDSLHQRPADGLSLVRSDFHVHSSAEEHTSVSGEAEPVQHNTMDHVIAIDHGKADMIELDRTVGHAASSFSVSRVDDEKKLASYWMLMAARAWATGDMVEGGHALTEALTFGAEPKEHIEMMLEVLPTARQEASISHLNASLPDIPVAPEEASFSSLKESRLDLRSARHDASLWDLPSNHHDESLPPPETTHNDLPSAAAQLHTAPLADSMELHSTPKESPIPQNQHAESAMDSPRSPTTRFLLEDRKPFGDLTTSSLSPVRATETNNFGHFAVMRSGNAWRHSVDLVEEEKHLSSPAWRTTTRKMDMSPESPQSPPLPSSFVVETSTSVRSRTPLGNLGLDVRALAPRTTPSRRRLFQPPELVEKPDRRRSEAVREIGKLLGEMNLSKSPVQEYVPPTTPRLKREIASITPGFLSAKKPLLLPDDMVPVKSHPELDGSSVTVLTPVRAKPKERDALGVPMYVTQVRRSLRNLPTDEGKDDGMYGDENDPESYGSPQNSMTRMAETMDQSRKLQKLMEENSYAFKPNRAIDQEESLAMLRSQLL